MQCVVSGCSNRSVNNNRGIFSRPPKRFFSFPEDPTRVKVWLAALRETDKQDSVEQCLICEDHFLPEDISKHGVTSDAIPIMPPCLDGDMGMMSPWAAEEEDPWAADDDDDDGVDEDEEEKAAEVDVPAELEVSAPEPPTQDPQRLSGAAGSSDAQHPSSRSSRAFLRQASLGVLTQRFLEMLLASPNDTLDLGLAAANLKTGRRRVYDITNVLDGIGLIQKDSASVIKWIGKYPVLSFMHRRKLQFQRELQNLKLVEDTLDTLIKSCAQQLFEMTDQSQNAVLAYVTQEDVSRLQTFQEQTVLVVKAPEETKLEVPPPREDSIQMHLKGGRGPITVKTCDIGGTSGCFVMLEESRIKTSTLHTESSSSQSATQSA